MQNTFGRRISGAVALLSAMALLLLSGCGEKKQTAALPGAEIRAESGHYSAPPPPSVARSSGLVIRGPQSQEEIDRAYRRSGGSAPAYQPPSAHVSAPAYAPSTDPEVSFNPSWNVRITREWRHIVIHHSDSAVGSAAIFDRAHKARGWDGLGYHFVIGNGSASGDGEVEVGYRWREQKTGAHAGNAEYNQAGIGICLVGDFEHNYATPAQMASLRQLVRFLQVKTGVPTYEIIGHCNVPPPHTQCPGAHFDMAAFRASMGNAAIGGMRMVPDTTVYSAPAPASRPVKLVRSTPRGGGTSAALP